MNSGGGKDTVGQSPAKTKPANSGKTPADRGKAPTDRGMTPTDRGKTPADRGKTPADRGKTPADRGKTPADRGKTPADRGKTPADRGKTPWNSGRSKTPRRKSPSESDQRTAKHTAMNVRMSELEVQSLEKEPKVAGASCLRHGEEIEQLKGDNQQLTEQVKKLEDANKSLRESVEHSEEEKGELSTKVQDLTAKLQNSSRSETRDRVDGAAMTEEDTDNESDLFQSFKTEGTESTDGPHTPLSDLQSFGKMAGERHTHGHMEQSELAAKAVKKQREGEAPFGANPSPHWKETPAIDGRGMWTRNELEQRLWHFEAELNNVKKERDEQKHEVAKVRDECERAKQKTVADAEKDKKLLMKDTEDMRRTNESLNDLLKERDDTLQRLQEDLLVTKAINDTPGVKQANAVDCERCHSFPLQAGEAVRKADSPSSSLCALANDQESEQLKSAQEALTESQRREQELTESAQTYLKERESKEEELSRLRQQHQAEVDELTAKLKTAEDNIQQLQEKLARQEELRQVAVDRMKTTVKAAEDSPQLLENERERQEEMARRLRLQQQSEDKLKAKVKAFEDTVQHLQDKLESAEEALRRLQHQHQRELDGLKAKVKAAEEKEKRCKNSCEIKISAQEREANRVKEKLHDTSQEIGNLQAAADGLRSQIVTLQAALQKAREENADGLRSQLTALQVKLREAREENVARTQHEAKLTSQFQTDTASRDSFIKQLKEKCEQLEAQATIYKLDFEQERSDRAEAAGRFDEERLRWQADVATVTEKMKQLHLERDDSVTQLQQLKEVHVSQKKLQKELKDKEDQLRHANGSCTGLEKKLSSIHVLHDRLAKENNSLQAKLQSQEKDIKAFKAIQAAYQETFDEAKKYKGLYHEAESKRSAAASRVDELAMVVNAIEEKNRGDPGEGVEALRQEIQRMKGHNDAMEASCHKVAVEKQQLTIANQELQSQKWAMEREIETLKGRRAMAGGPEMSLAARSSQGGGGFRSFQGSIGATGSGDQHNAMPPVISGQLRAKQRMDGNGWKGDFAGGQFAGDFVERDSPPSSHIEGKGPSSLELISLPPAALARGKQPESRFNVPAGRGARPGTDPRMAAGHPPPRGTQQPIVGMSHAMAESHGQPPRGQLPNTTPNQANAYAPSWTLGKHPTDPCLNRQESSASANTEGSLPMPFTRPPGPVAASPDDSLLSSFEADQRYIGEGINTEIRREAHRYKKVEVGAVAAPVQADDQEWPLDPNLTCPYCNVVFRRGQMREYRYHVDECQP